MRGEGEVNPCTDLPLRADRGVLCRGNPLPLEFGNKIG